MAIDLIDQIYKNKNNFSPQFLTINDLNKELSNFSKIKKPIVIADPSDNVGGGALGNNIEILEILVKKKLPGIIVIWSPFLRGKRYSLMVFRVVMMFSRFNFTLYFKNPLF